MEKFSIPNRVKTLKIAREDTNFSRDYSPFVLLFSQLLQIFTTFTLAMVVDIHTHNTQTHAQTPVTVGVHPWHALNNDIAEVEAKATEVDAIGEIGLDFACDAPRERQIATFRAQLAIAERVQKPVVLHCVRAFEEVIKILSEYRLPAVIFHGFIGSANQAQRAVAEGFYLSFGERTFRSPKTIEAMRSTPLSHLFVETDESPTPIEDIYAKIAILRGITTSELLQATERNFQAIFNS